MVDTRLARILGATAFLAALSACTTMEGAYDSVSNAFGGDDKPASPKMEVRSPAAAPVQGVQAGDIGTPAQPVELGRMTSDMSQPGSQSAMDERPAPIVPAPAQQPQPMIAANTKPPVLEPSAAPVAAPAMAPAAAPMAANADAAAVALLTVRFNQPHVYYEDALAQSVSAAERAKPGVMYDVLSTVPDLTSLPSDAQTKLSARAKDNLRNVVIQMQQQGIPAGRIRIAEQTLKIRSQEIRVFVR